jgi:exosortase
VTQSSDSALVDVRSRAAAIELFFLLAISLVLWQQPLAASLHLALVSDAHTHILLILPLSLALIFIRIRDVVPMVAVGRWTGAILLGAALLIRGLTVWNQGRVSYGNGLSLAMFALVVWWIGCILICYGVKMFRTLLFPLSFLFLLVPFPERMLDWITQTLQYQSAAAAELLFHAARVPVTRDGVFLSIPGLDIEVARECSSIRSSTILIVVTLVLAHLFLRTRWRQVLLVAIAIPLSVAKNAGRIFTIAELGTRVDSGYLNGRLHHNGGILFLGLAVFVMIGLLWLLGSGEVRVAGTTGDS